MASWGGVPGSLLGSVFPESVQANSTLTVANIPLAAALGGQFAVKLPVEMRAGVGLSTWGYV